MHMTPDASTSRNMRTLSYVGGVAVLFAVYFVTAKLGLLMDAVSGFATLVWAPTGIAIAALFLFGLRFWPGVALGALLVNYQTGAPVLVALGIALGNTLEAVLAVTILKRANFTGAFYRLSEALGFIAFAVIVSTTVSATIGVASLWLGGIVAEAAWLRTWLAWWVGDALGALIVAPFIITWVVAPRPVVKAERVGEGAALALALLATGWLVFGAGSMAPQGPIAYIVFLPLLWAALRFGPVGTTTATFVLAAMAIWGTATGHGPFVRGTLSDSLFFLQLFIAVIAGTKLVVASVVAERGRAAEELRIFIQALERRVAERSGQLTDANVDLRRSEETLGKKTMILQALLHVIEEGVAAVSKDGRPLLVNPAAMRIVGMLPSEITTPFENIVEKFPTFYPDGKTPVPFSELPLTRALNGEETVAATLIIRTPEAPKGMKIRVTAKPVKDDKGEIIAGVSVFSRIED